MALKGLFWPEKAYFGRNILYVLVFVHKKKGGHLGHVKAYLGLH